MIAPNAQMLAPIKNNADARLVEHTQVLAAIGSITVKTPAEVDWAAATIQNLADQHKAMKAECESVAKPLRDAARKVSKWWKPSLDACTGAMNHLKSSIQQYRNEQAALAQAALAQSPTIEEVQRSQEAILATPAGLAERLVYRGQVVDESKLPRHFWIIDQAAIDKAIQGAKGHIDIPGVQNITETKIVRTGR